MLLQEPAPGRDGSPLGDALRTASVGSRGAGARHAHPCPRGPYLVKLSGSVFGYVTGAFSSAGSFWSTLKVWSSTTKDMSMGRNLVMSSASYAREDPGAGRAQPHLCPAGTPPLARLPASTLCDFGLRACPSFPPPETPPC